MTKRELEQYKSLCREIGVIQRRITTLTDKDISVVAGTVQASMSTFPYIMRHVNVEMYEPVAMEKYNATIKILERRLNKCNEAMLSIENFIDSIDDSGLRMIFRLRYIDGLKLREVAKKVNLEISSVSVKISRHLQKCQTNQKKM